MFMPAPTMRGILDKITRNANGAISYAKFKFEASHVLMGL